MADLRSMLQSMIYQNLFNTHPPIQIDGPETHCCAHLAKSQIPAHGLRGSASQPAGGAGKTVRSQAEPGNEARKDVHSSGPETVDLKAGQTCSTRFMNVQYCPGG